jgi:hypothetical protein
MSMQDSSEELMKGLMYKLYKTVTGSDENIKMPRNKFISWFMPGLAFSVEDFRFCQKGFTDESAEKVLENYHNAFMLSKLFDFVPEIPEPSNENNEFKDSTKLMQTIFATTQDTISSIWRDTLKHSRVVNFELSDKEKQKLENFRNKLAITKEVTDIVTDEKKSVTEPGPLTIAYNNKMAEYMKAADEYYDLLIDAQSATGTDPEAKRRVAEFANKSKFKRNMMEAAYMAWVSQGYKNEYEQINAYIDQVTQKSMVLYKQDLLRKFERAMLTSASDGGSDFYYTTLIPGNFATNPSWTKFDFYQADYESQYKKDSKNWKASGGVRFGAFAFGGSGKKDKQEISGTSKATNFKATLEFTQVPIMRPWFDPGFYVMRGWDLDKLWEVNYGDVKVSDGGQKPIGRLVAYPITALFVRNVHLQFNEYQTVSNAINETISAGGGGGYLGIFAVSGKYTRGKEEKSFESSDKGGDISIPGIQLIGLINNLVPKAPNLDPRIKPEQLVGGEEEELKAPSEKPEPAKTETKEQPK